MTRRERIIAELKTASETILTANGYNTNAGEQAFANRSYTISDDDTFPLINIIEDEDSVSSQKGLTGVMYNLQLPISVEAHNNCDPLDPSPKGYELLSDLKKCFLSLKTSSDILSIKYSGATIGQHENGSSYVRARVSLIINYIENTSDPEW